MRFSLILVCYLILALCIAQSQAKDLAKYGVELVSHINDHGKLGTPKVRAIVQDQHGFLWIGSEHGLFRYDGYDFKAFTHNENDPNSIAENKIYTLLVARDGRIWIGTKSTLSVYDPQSGHFKAFQNDDKNPNSLVNNEVYRLYEDKDGGIWVSTFGGLSYLSYGQESFENYRANTKGASSLSHSIVYDTIEDRHGKMLIATDAGIDILDPVSKTVSQLHYNVDNIKTITAYNFFKDSHQRIWLGSFKRGLMWLGDDDRTIIPGHTSHKQFAALPTSVIRTIIQSNDKEIWASVYGRGIAIIDRESGKLLRVLSKQHGIDTSLADNTVHTMLKDRTGLIWIGYLAGKQTLSVINSNASSSRILYSHSDDPTELNIKQATAMGRLPSGSYLIAGEGLNIINSNGKLDNLPSALNSIDSELRTHSPSSNNEPVKISHIKSLKNGKVAFAYKSRKIKIYNPKNGSLTDLEVADFCKSLGASMLSQTHAWFACNALSLLRVNLDTGENTQFEIRSPANIKYSYTNKILINKEGTLWISSEHGLFTLRNASLATNDTQVKASHLLNKDVTNILIDKKDNIWADTTDGLFKAIPSTSKIVFNKQEGIVGAPSGSFFRRAMIEDNKGRLWGEKGVYDISGQRFYALDKSDGYYLNQSSFASYYNDQEMLFSTPNGILSILSNNFSSSDHSANLSISEVLLDNKPVQISQLEQITMQAGASTLYVELSVLDFTDPLKNKYRYKLQREESSWQDLPQGQRSILFSNLAPGNYTLKLQGKNSKNISSIEPPSLRINVLPQWYQSLYFKVAASICFFLLLFSFYKLRTHQHQQAQKKLSKLVSDRTKEIKDKNKNLEEQSLTLSSTLNELMETQEQLLEKEKMASLGELVSGIAHEVNTPLGIGVTAASHLNDNSKALQDAFDQGELTQDMLKNYLDKTSQTSQIILANLIRSSDLIKSFKNISVDQRNDLLSSIELQSYLEQILDTLSPALKSANCKVQLQCPEGIKIRSYPGLIAQLISNLVNNSIIHGCGPNEGGNISISVSKNEKDGITISHSDDGVGIDTNIIKKIYDPFFTTKRGEGGSGLGLSIVFNLVTQRLGGEIHCRTQAPEGARFEVYLPLEINNDVNNSN